MKLLSNKIPSQMTSIRLTWTMSAWNRCGLWPSIETTEGNAKRGFGKIAKKWQQAKALII